jgi:hypothetical protein
MLECGKWSQQAEECAFNWGRNMYTIIGTWLLLWVKRGIIGEFWTKEGHDQTCILEGCSGSMGRILPWAGRRGWLLVHVLRHRTRKPHWLRFRSREDLKNMGEWAMEIMESSSRLNRKENMLCGYRCWQVRKCGSRVWKSSDCYDLFSEVGIKVNNWVLAVFSKCIKHTITFSPLHLLPPWPLSTLI